MGPRQKARGFAQSAPIMARYQPLFFSRTPTTSRWPTRHTAGNSLRGVDQIRTEGIPRRAIPAEPTEERASNYRLRDFAVDKTAPHPEKQFRWTTDS